MKDVNAAVPTAIRTAHEVKALPRLTAEWNMNRFRSATLKNTPTEESAGFDPEMFPLESIVEPNRPTKGINKGLVGNALAADEYTSPSDPRFYVASIDDEYKYWTSPFPSDSNTVISGCAPQVIYDTNVQTNKLVIGVENTWASPGTWTVQVTTNKGSTWTTISNTTALDNDGRQILYWSGTNWTLSKPARLDNFTEINGVKITVTRLNSGKDGDGNITRYKKGNDYVNTLGRNSHFSLIEISPRLELDLTDRLITTSDTFDAGGGSQVTPLGTITSNVGEVSLWNGDGMFSSQTNGMLKGMIEPNVVMNMQYVYHLNGTTYPVQEFKMYVDKWTEGSDSQVSVSLTDASKYLKETTAPKAKYENLTLSQIVYRICDSVGFTDYNITGAMTSDFRIPIFWTDGSATVWEVFDELATATQSLITFDAWGRLNVKTREEAFNPAAQPIWTLRATKSGNELPDIEDLSETNEYGANVIKVKYKSVNWAGEVNGHPEMTTVWSPEDTVTLRATQLTGALPVNADYISISPTEAKHWPYEGHVQIEGEFIEYSGKWFKYLDGSTWKTEMVYNHKDFEKKNEKTLPADRHKNQFLGRLKVKERGVWGTAPVAHNPDAAGWSGKRYNLLPNDAWGSKQFHVWQKNKSSVRLRHGGGLKNTNQFAMLLRGADADTGWRHMGTRLKFNGNKLGHHGGIMFNQRGGSDGYYIELRPTNTIANKDRERQDEITLYSMKNGNYKKITSGSRDASLIVADQWHDLDVYYQWATQTIIIYLDGKKIYRISVPSAQQHAPGGKFGMFIRGKSDMECEYFYAVAREDREPTDNAGFYDRVRGGFVGDMWNREWVYNKKTKYRWARRRGRKKKDRFVWKEIRQNLQFFDDFGPYVHEVREFEVDFDPAPVAHSRLFMTNEWSVVCPEYRSSAFGAYFILANSARVNATVSGEDSLTFALSGSSVEQKLMVIGRSAVIGEQEEVEVRNENHIRSRGEIVSEIDSEWIQSEAAARAVADWIEAHWADGADEVTVQIFGNPLLEVGDLVAVDFPSRFYTAATHQYFVTSISTSFEGGLSSEVVLQRKN